ncbi:MAG TPA: kelch repeat-containing protein [Holophagaceae bacterium]|nr:kelch repeat-containing protein [Holophagaceae bacterium]
MSSSPLHRFAAVCGAALLALQVACSPSTSSSSIPFEVPSSSGIVTFSPTPAPGASVTTNPQVLTVAVGATVALNADHAGHGSPGQRFSYTVTPASLGTMSASDGKFTATAMGTGTITATCTSLTGYTGSLSVTVIAGPVASALVPSDANPPRGGSITLTPTFSNGTGKIGSTGLNSSDVAASATSGMAVSTGAITAPTTFTLTVTHASGLTATTTCAVTPQTVAVAALSPAAPTMTVGTSQAFSTSVTGGLLNTVTWSASAGSITSGGLFTAPTTAQAVTVTATSVDDPSKSASTTVTVSAVAVPPSGTLAASSTNPPYKATNVTLTPTWSGGTTSATVGTTTGGSDISSNAASGVAIPVQAGGFTTATTYWLRTRNAVGATADTSVTLTPQTVAVAALSPASPSLTANTTQTFTTTVTGGATNAVTWSASAGTITSGGLFTAPTTAQSVTVTATSVDDPSKSASTTVTVTAAGPTITSDPTSVHTTYGQTATFSVTASGTGLITYQWQKNGVNVPMGGTGSTYTTPALTLADSGSTYHCIVSDASGQPAVTSLDATLTVDPQGVFASTSAMGNTRMAFTATRLTDGRVVVIGGEDGTAFRGQAETGTPDATGFSPNGTMLTPRSHHTATLLGNGKILVVGGGTASGATTSAELYDPSAPVAPGVTGSFATTGSLSNAREDHTATLLANGKVLIVGGGAGGGARLASAELYDPAAGTFSPVGSLATGRTLHTATLLDDGKVLIIGGQDAGNAALASMELFDPADNQFHAVATTLANARYRHTATKLLDGTVLIWGGGFNLPERYHPADGSMGGAGGPGAGFPPYLPLDRTFHTATLLPNGQVLITGGIVSGSGTATAELWDPVSGFTNATGNMSLARAYHAAVRLLDGRVLILGGNDYAGTTHNQTEVFQ